MAKRTTCRICLAPLPVREGPGRPRVYCSRDCKDQAQRNRERFGHEPSISSTALLNALKGANALGVAAHYDNYKAWPRVEEHLGGALSNADVAVVFAIDERTAAAWKRQLLAERDTVVAKAEFQLAPEFAAMLEPTVDGFVAFYLWLLPGTASQPTRVATFHRQWIAGLIDAYLHGNRYAIQAPQRFGKTQLLVAFMVWQILRDPNTCILFVARTKELAEQSTGMVRRILEDSDRLREAFLPEGLSFQPARMSSMSWTDADLTVATRTEIRRSPTLTAVGAGGTLLGRDADHILADDLEDFRNAQSPTQRDALKLWFTSDLTSRKEEHTGWAYIGSSQHPEDLLSMLREDPQWRVDVFAAHSAECTAELWVADPDDPAEPANPDDHVDCCLWPEVRSYRWLFTNRQTARDRQRWDMNMLGVVEDGALQVFPRELVEAALDHQAVLGRPDPGWRLIAGLDPGGGGQTGYLSAVLWGVEDDIRTVVDIYDVHSGGLQAIRDVFHQWHRDYGLVDWVVEMNIAAAYLYDDHTLADIRHRNGIRIIEHRTYNNKLDNAVGVPSMKAHFQEGRIRLPYGDERSRQLVGEYIRQLRRWSPRASARAHYRTDILMASWFPEATIRSWRDDQPVDVTVEDGFTRWDSAWASNYDYVGAS